MANASRGNCVGCGKEFSAKGFFPNHNKFLKKYNNGRMLYCVDCCKKIGDEIMDEYASFEMGIKNVAHFFNMPISELAIEKLKSIYQSKNEEVDWNWVRQYGACLQECGVTEDMWINLTSEADMFDEKNRKLDDESFKGLKQLEYLWGDRTLKEYEFLEKRWQLYTDGLKLNTAQSSLYRQLCIEELEIRNKEKDKESTKEAQGELIKLMTKLRIDKFESNDKSLLERTLEKKCDIIEEHDPAEWYKDRKKFKDYAGIEKYMKDHVKRPFRNLLLNSKDYKILNEFIDGATNEKK